ncbi:hypothetical protein RvY_10345 [Ramazzottius varieornatus]|uniref:Uncharacterized protein n=1 Tax=Ramazzottius varieornatus TaxID=947166 RepID=A0A1D1VCF3_RAMVA|nr:hypothetical protein RvY_10345 [Ramazzottius varieornatus]
MWELLIYCALAMVVGGRAERLPGQTTRRHGSGLRVDPNEMYVRIQAEVIRLINDKGLTAVNSYCDTLQHCDPLCYAHLDTDRPNAEWPGAVATNFWQEILKIDDVDSPYINKTITRDSCAKPYREAVLRVFCEDYDPATSNDLINKWECAVNRSPYADEGSAQWSAVADCTPKFHPGSPNSIRLTFRYRIFLINKSICNASVVPIGAKTTTTKVAA